MKNTRLPLMHVIQSAVLRARKYFLASLFVEILYSHQVMLVQLQTTSTQSLSGSILKRLF